MISKYYYFFISLAISAINPAFALTIIPGTIGDVHFTSGPCPIVTPTDTTCKSNGINSATCPAFYNPKILPPGYNSVSYCSQVVSQDGLELPPGYNVYTVPLNSAEQAAYIQAERGVEAEINDNVTLTFEVYKIGYLDPTGQKNGGFSTEFFTPVCISDLLLPPYSNKTPQIERNPNGSFSYVGVPQTYDFMIGALKLKNSLNRTKFNLTPYLPSDNSINMEWSSTFLGYQAESDIDEANILNFLITTPNLVPPAPGTEPLTICTSPSNIKALGLDVIFNTPNFKFADINSPQNDIYVTLPGTDGALAMGDAPDQLVHGLPYPDTTAINYYPYFLNDNDPEIQADQLPLAFYKTNNLAAPLTDDCANPTQCRFPAGFNWGYSFQHVVRHETHHLMGLMWSEYYKQGGNNNGLAYAYDNAIFLDDLFILDSDYVVSGYGHRGIRSPQDWAAAPRNMNSNEPVTAYKITDLSQLTPWIQFGQHDHLFVWMDNNGSLEYFPLSNYTIGNPDGDSQIPIAEYLPSSTYGYYVFSDPAITNLPSSDELHTSTQASAVMRGEVPYDGQRELENLSALGWDVNYSAIENNVNPAPTAAWYAACFNQSTGSFLSGNKYHGRPCKFSVEPQDLQ